jgi:hypothetical protein
VRLQDQFDFDASIELFHGNGSQDAGRVQGAAAQIILQGIPSPISFQFQIKILKSFFARFELVLRNSKDKMIRDIKMANFDNWFW